MKNTHFCTPHGLDNDDHYTTAFELALLSNYALRNKVFADVVNTLNYTVFINGVPKSIHNTNELLGNVDGVYGIKTGFTNGANRCLVSCCKRNNLDIICVVLGADTKNFRTSDSIKLIDFTFQNFELVNLRDLMTVEFDKWKSKNLNFFVVEKGASNIVNFDVDYSTFSTFPIYKDFISDLNVDISCDKFLTAPGSSGSCIGSITCKVGDSVLLQNSIKLTSSIYKKSVFDYFIYFFKLHKYICVY